MVSELFASRDIEKGVVKVSLLSSTPRRPTPASQVLWEYFTLTLPDSDPKMSWNVIVLLGMCGLSGVSVISANNQVRSGGEGRLP